MRKSAALAASLSVLLVWLVVLNVHLRRHDAATQALKTLHLVIDGAGQIHRGEATGADSRSISLDLGSTADLAAGAAHSQTIHLDLDQHGHIHNAVSGGRVVSLTLNSDGQVVPDTDARSAVPGDRMSSLAQEKEGVPNYNTYAKARPTARRPRSGNLCSRRVCDSPAHACSYPKLTWPEPPHGFGMYGGRSAARHGRAHQGYAAAVPIVIQLPPDANARRPHHTEALRAADGAHSEDDMFHADEKRLLRRMSDRMRSRERKEVKVRLCPALRPLRCRRDSNGSARTADAFIARRVGIRRRRTASWARSPNTLRQSQNSESSAMLLSFAGLRHGTRLRD